MTRVVVSLSVAAAVALGVGACSRQRSDGADRARRDTATPTTVEPAGTAREAGHATSDAWITTKVRSQFFADDVVKARDIDVNTNNGTVTLVGHVDTDQQKARAEQIASKTDGVRGVENRLTVGRATAANARPVDERGPSLTSGWITTKVQAQYFAESALRGSDIDVDTHNGVVTLAGRVPSDEAKSRAVAIARATDGVRDVDDRLRVSAGPRDDTTGPMGTTGSGDRTVARDRDTSRDGPMDDAAITARIQSRFYSDDEVRGRKIDVDTSRGTVRLQGEVGSEAERRQAVRIAQRTPGVVKVDDQLKVSTSARRDRDEDQRTGSAHPVQDAWITTKIQSKYFIDSEVNATSVDVTTKAGTVTLTGRVDTSEAKRRAVELARATAGVRQVVDRLVVDAPGTRPSARR